MGFMGNILGLDGGNKGFNYTAGSADVQNPTNATQLNNAQNVTQGALSQQQALAQQLQGIGLGNQQAGIQGQMGVLGQQQGLAGQLQAQALGQGPNPAQAALSNATGQNIAAQNALMAGQRGAGANVGLMAEQAARQGANTQQQSVGQGALMQAQQSLAAQQQLQQQQSAMAQGYGNVTNAGLNQGNQQQAALNALTQGAIGSQGQLLGAQQGYNNALVGNQASQNSANAAIAQGTMGAQAGLLGGSGAGAMKIAGYYDGGLATIEGIYHPDKMACGGKVMKDGGKVPGKAKVEGDDPKNDTVKAKLSPGEIVIPRSVVESANPGEAARAFVEKILANKGKDATDKDHGDFKKALENAISKRKLK